MIMAVTIEANIESGSLEPAHIAGTRNKKKKTKKPKFNVKDTTFHLHSTPGSTPEVSTPEECRQVHPSTSHVSFSTHFGIDRWFQAAFLLFLQTSKNLT